MKPKQKKQHNADVATASLRVYLQITMTDEMQKAIKRGGQTQIIDKINTRIMAEVKEQASSVMDELIAKIDALYKSAQVEGDRHDH